MQRQSLHLIRILSDEDVPSSVDLIPEKAREIDPSLCPGGTTDRSRRDSVFEFLIHAMPSCCSKKFTFSNASRWRMVCSSASSVSSNSATHRGCASTR